MARIGLLGFANVGKTTIFNALTGLDAITAAHPFATTEPNVGVAKVPDSRLDEAAVLEESAKTVYATLDLLDLPAIGKAGEGVGAQFIGRLREMDALAAVLRSFEDGAVPTDIGGTDPVTQAEDLLVELTLADFEVFDRRRDKIGREATSDPSKRPAADAIAAATAVLEEGTPLRAVEWTESQELAFRDLAPLTIKPGIWIVNIAEDADPGAAAESVKAVVPGGDTVVALSAKIEEEAAELTSEERAEMFDELGLGEGALATVVRAAYGTLGLLSFYTLGPKESRAWTVRSGAAAPEAAGKIHSDLERGFIRSEVCHMDVIIFFFQADDGIRDGLIRLEGKEYVVTGGDALMVRFSV